MGSCVTRYRELDLTADSFSDTLLPGAVKFYGITLTREWIEKKKDLVVRVHVEKGSAHSKRCNTHNTAGNGRRQKV
jgi:hypothetical protein